jgi:hypothetical protein
MRDALSTIAEGAAACWAVHGATLDASSDAAANPPVKLLNPNVFIVKAAYRTATPAEHKTS